MQDPRFQLDSRLVRRRFDRAAAGFDDADFVHRSTADGLFARLEPLQLKPAFILDLGCATGAALPTLEKRFRGSRVIGVDFSAGMTARANARGGWLSRISAVQADARALPFADHGMGLVFSNLLLPWIADPDQLFGEVSRVLQKDGAFAFTALGPDSLARLGEAFADEENLPRINGFADMHNIGDGLVRAGLRDPVLDVDRLVVTYTSAHRLFSDLTAAGARNALVNRAPGLLGRKRFAAATEKLESESPFTIELEIVYGHAWGSGQRPGEARVDAGMIPIRGR